MVILPEIPQGRRIESMKKTNGRSRTDPHIHDVIGTNPKKQHRKEAHSIVNNQHMNMVWYARCGMRCICMIWQEMNEPGLNLEIQVCHWKDEMKSLENDIKNARIGVTVGNGKRCKYGHVLRFTASSHLNAMRWTCYSTQTWQQNAWKGCIHEA